METKVWYSWRNDKQTVRELERMRGKRLNQSVQTLSWAVDREREQTSGTSCEPSLEQLLCYHSNGSMQSGFDLGLYHETPSAETNHSGLKTEDRRKDELQSQTEVSDET